MGIYRGIICSISIIKLNYDVRKIFATEHGLRGTEPNGAKIDVEIDVKDLDHFNKVLVSLRTSEFVETVSRL